MKGVDQSFDIFLLLQKRHDLLCILSMSVHADGKRLNPTQHEERVHRSLHATNGILQVSQLLAKFLVLADDRAANHV